MHRIKGNPKQPKLNNGTFMDRSIKGLGGTIPPHIPNFLYFNINFEVLNYNIY